MLDWKGVASAAACAVVATAGMARGEVGGYAGVEELSLSRPLMLQDAATAPATDQAPAAAKKPLMALLDSTPVGAKVLDPLNINLYGYIEGGYTASFSAPPRNVITGNVFNTKHESVVLDGIDFNVERTVDPAAAAKNHTWDIGGHAEALFGWDAGAIHSHGLFDYYRSRYSPENQFDLLQAYFDIALPVGNGLQIRGGKFVTLLGYEVIQANGNPLYSHSYLFGYAIPFTQTGILGKYLINDQWTVQAGITRGWNQSTKDNNGAIDFLGELTYTPSTNDSFTLNVSEGPQAAHDNSDYWTVLDFIATHKFNDKLSATLNADYGDAPHALGKTTAQWYGAAVYGQYILNDYLTLNARGEWYSDNNGFTLGTGANLQVYEATVGVAITPIPHNDILKNLVVRPELRFDYASHRYFDGGTDYYQGQFAIDAMFQF